MLLNGMSILLVVILASLVGVVITLLLRVKRLDDSVQRLEIKNSDNSKIVSILLSETKEIEKNIKALEQEVYGLTEIVSSEVNTLHEEIEVLEHTIESILEVNNMQSEEIELSLEEANSNIDVLSDITDISIVELANEIEELKKQIMVLHDIEGEHELDELITTDDGNEELDNGIGKLTRLAKKFIDLE